MISEFPHSITETANRAENLQRQDTTKKNLMGPILFLYYEESLVSSNLNSKLLRSDLAGMPLLILMIN